MRGQIASGLVAHMGEVNPRLQVRIGFQKAGVRAPAPLQGFLDHNQRSVRIPAEPPTIRVFLAANGKFADREVRRNGFRERQSQQLTHDPSSGSGVSNQEANLTDC